jgi:hypothetical protein
MAEKPFGVGKSFYFLGSFTSKLAAARKEAQHPGSFIHVHKGRYYVLKPKKIKSNPGRKTLTLIYGRIESVNAQKTGFHRHCDAECKRAKHKYVHDFKPGAKLLGIPDGCYLVCGQRVIRLSNGSMLISDREY